MKIDLACPVGTSTLIIAAEGIYDPRQLNDRLRLGLKGTMSEAELGWLRQRAHEARAAKARRGELIISLPVGYVQTRDGRLEKHPDQRVQAALVFRKFAELGAPGRSCCGGTRSRSRCPRSSAIQSGGIG